MSRSVDIFIRSDKSATELAVELSQVLGLRLAFDGRDAFRQRDPEKQVYLHEHAFEDDLGIAFSSYKYALAIRTSPIRFQNELVNEYFAKMKSQTRYPLLVVEDTQVELARRD